MTRASIPQVRIRAINQAPPRGSGEFVLYWMAASRRLGHNYALQRAVDWAQGLDTARS